MQNGFLAIHRHCASCQTACRRCLDGRSAYCARQPRNGGTLDQSYSKWERRDTAPAVGAGVNTAFIERLNATFRLRLNNLVRRTRTLARRSETLVAGMYLVGCFYNFCDTHHSLRLKLSVGSFGHHWVQRTPAIAASLTDHQWTPTELLNFKVPPPRWELPKQRGRTSTAMLQLAQQWIN